MQTRGFLLIATASVGGVLFQAGPDSLWAQPQSLWTNGWRSSSECRPTIRGAALSDPRRGSACLMGRVAQAPGFLPFPTSVQGFSRVGKSAESAAHERGLGCRPPFITGPGRLSLSKSEL
jgi:hypothetical protein